MHESTPCTIGNIATVDGKRVCCHVAWPEPHDPGCDEEYCADHGNHDPSPMVAEIISKPTTIGPRRFEPRPLFIEDTSPWPGALVVTDDGQSWYLDVDHWWYQVAGLAAVRNQPNRGGLSPRVTWSSLVAMGGWLVWDPASLRS